MVLPSLWFNAAAASTARLQEYNAKPRLDGLIGVGGSLLSLLHTITLLAACGCLGTLQALEAQAVPDPTTCEVTRAVIQAYRQIRAARPAPGGLPWYRIAVILLKANQMHD